MSRSRVAALHGRDGGRRLRLAKSASRGGGWRCRISLATDSACEPRAAGLGELTFPDQGRGTFVPGVSQHTSWGALGAPGPWCRALVSVCWKRVVVAKETHERLQPRFAHPLDIVGSLLVCGFSPLPQRRRRTSGRHGRLVQERVSLSDGTAERATRRQRVHGSWAALGMLDQSWIREHMNSSSLKVLAAVDVPGRWDRGRESRRASGPAG